MAHPKVHAFFDHETWTLTYLVFDSATRDAIIIDPVLHYDVLSSQTSTKAVAEVVATIEAEGLVVRSILETHAHADHLSAAQYLAARYHAPVGIGRGIELVQKTFSRIFNLKAPTVDGSQFDVLMDGGTATSFGSLKVDTLKTPGHTPACVSYLIGDALFTGDALFLEDYGTGRTDFPAGSAKDLYHSVHEVLYRLPGETRVFVGHDYQPGGREVRFESTIAREREHNVQLREQTTESEFVTFRQQRDATLRPPRLIYPSIQVNIFAGKLPASEDNGRRYLKIPLNHQVPTDEAGNPSQESAQAAE